MPYSSLAEKTTASTGKIFTHKEKYYVLESEFHASILIIGWGEDEAPETSVKYWSV